MLKGSEVAIKGRETAIKQHKYLIINTLHAKKYIKGVPLLHKTQEEIEKENTLKQKKAFR